MILGRDIEVTSVINILYGGREEGVKELAKCEICSGRCWPQLTSKKGCPSPCLQPLPRSPCCSSSCPPGFSSGEAETRLRRCRKQPRHLVLSWVTARYITTDSSAFRFRGLYYSLFPYNHSYKKLLYFIKNSSIL